MPRAAGSRFVEDQRFSRGVQVAREDLHQGIAHTVLASPPGPLISQHNDLPIDGTRPNQPGMLSRDSGTLALDTVLLTSSRLRRCRDFNYPGMALL
jgi:hypothetical protein